MNILLSMLVHSKASIIILSLSPGYRWKRSLFRSSKNTTCSLSNVVNKNIYILIHVHVYIISQCNMIDMLYTTKITFIFFLLIYLYYKHTQSYIIIICRYTGIYSSKKYLKYKSYLSLCEYQIQYFSINTHLIEYRYDQTAFMAKSLRLDIWDCKR